MMNAIFCAMVILSMIFALFNGRMEQLSAAAMEQAGNAVTLAFSLVGMLCLWSGLMKVAQEAGLTKTLGKVLSPLTRRLFRGLDPEGPAMQAVCMNMMANFLGLGNAATPLGIQAICEMKKEERAGTRATDNMAMFVVLNTAAFQLLPTTTALMRMQHGSAAPMEILPAVWIASAASVTVAVAAAKAMSKVWGRV